ncbi:MAG: greA 1 [Proteobacteria bacterium]|nr:greA 1 [Pseudomonadota bacterium]
MTAGGHAALESELQRRKSEERPRIIAAIAEARAHGDLSENAEYHAAKEQQSHNEGRVSELEEMLARSEIIDVSKLTGKTVKFGATVKLVDEDTEEEKTYHLLADRPRADRQDGGRPDRSRRPRWRQRICHPGCGFQVRKLRKAEARASA